MIFSSVVSKSLGALHFVRFFFIGFSVKNFQQKLTYIIFVKVFSKFPLVGNCFFVLVLQEKMIRTVPVWKENMF